MGAARRRSARRHVPSPRSRRGRRPRRVGRRVGPRGGDSRWTVAILVDEARPGLFRLVLCEAVALLTVGGGPSPM